MLEKLVVKQFLYPVLTLSPYNLPSGVMFSDQFAFRPTGSPASALISLFDNISSRLSMSSYVRVIALDFSRAFDTVRHSSFFNKLSTLPIPDNVYNWVLDFFSDRTHCTMFKDIKSSSAGINASVVQGSALGPISFVINASDLQPLCSSNALFKFADDTYLVMSSDCSDTCIKELEHIENWATANNLILNRKKSVELIFQDSKSRKHPTLPDPIPDIPRVKTHVMLGVTVSNDFRFGDHVTKILTSVSQSLYALRILKSHGMPSHSLHNVFKSTCLSRLAYAVSAWYGFTLAEERERIEAFLRKSQRLGYCSTDNKSFAEIVNSTDHTLFQSIVNNSSHVLHAMLPPKKTNTYNLRLRSHPFPVPLRTTRLMDGNFLKRMLLNDSF